MAFLPILNSFFENNINRFILLLTTESSTRQFLKFFCWAKWGSISKFLGEEDMIDEFIIILCDRFHLIIIFLVCSWLLNSFYLIWLPWSNWIWSIFACNDTIFSGLVMEAWNLRNHHLRYVFSFLISGTIKSDVWSCVIQYNTPLGKDNHWLMMEWFAKKSKKFILIFCTLFIFW